LDNSIKRIYKRDDTNIACSYMIALTQKNIYILIECSRPPLRFSFYSFFFSINEKLYFKELIIASQYRNISEILLEQPASQ